MKKLAIAVVASAFVTLAICGIVLAAAWALHYTVDDTGKGVVLLFSVGAGLTVGFFALMLDNM